MTKDRRVGRGDPAARTDKSIVLLDHVVELFRLSQNVSADEATEERVRLLRSGVELTLDLLNILLSLELKGPDREQVIAAVSETMSFMTAFAQFEAVGAGFAARKRASRRDETRIPATAKKAYKRRLRDAIRPHIAEIVGRLPGSGAAAILKGIEAQFSGDSRLASFAELARYTKLKHIRAVKLEIEAGLA